jgi:1,4-alpha-glucan branching enzyme
MGCEFGATSEWNYKSELQWDLLKFDSHRLLKDCVRDLNKLLTTEPALYENQFSTAGFEWVDLNHRAECVMVYKRKAIDPKDEVLVVLNMTPVVRRDWKIVVQGKKEWKEIFNSDLKKYWGTGDVFNPTIPAVPVEDGENFYEITVHLPPLAGIVLK